jgi:hypothetical protein
MAGTQYRGSELKNVDQFLDDADGLDSEREKEIGQHIGYRYDVNLVPDYERLTPFLKKYLEIMGWDDLNWLEDIHRDMRKVNQPYLIEISMVGFEYLTLSIYRTINKIET